MKLISGLQVNIEVFYKLIQSFRVCVTRHAQGTQNKFTYLCNISRKAWVMKLILLPADKHRIKVLYKLIVSLWVCIAKHAKSTQYIKFTISLQYLKENWKNEVDFSPADKRQRFLQSDTIILGVCGQACLNYPK